MAKDSYQCGDCNNCLDPDRGGGICIFEIHDDWPRGEWTEDTLFPPSFFEYIRQFTWADEYLDPEECPPQEEANELGQKTIASALPRNATKAPVRRSTRLLHTVGSTAVP